MERIYYDNPKPITFEEHINFDYEVPHTIRIRYYNLDDIVPLHYADDTLEVLLCDDLIGEVTIESRRFTTGGKQVFVIPPKTVHSTTISRCRGTMHILKFSFPALADFINITNILAFNKCDITQLAYSCPVYDKLLKIVRVMIREDHNIFSRMRSIISIIEILEKYKTDSPDINYYSEQKDNDALKSLITWTTANYYKKITIDQAAKVVNYSKFHFCRWFKDLTGISYITYLNRVRTVQACKLLRQGKSISEICFACGFGDISYFIQLFKKVQGCTPRCYIKNVDHNEAVE